MAATEGFFPDYASPPGESLEDVLEERGMSQAELSERTGLARKTVNEIIKGKAPITADSALHLERVLGLPAHFWNRRERIYREHLARLQERDRMKEWTDWLASIPCREMQKRGWIEKKQNDVDQLQAVLRFFGVASPREWQNIWMEPANVVFRRSLKFESEPGHLAAWLRYGEMRALSSDCDSFDERRFRASLQDARGLTRELPEAFMPVLKEKCAAAGVVVALVPQLPKARVSGVTRWLRKDLALIQLSLRYKTNDHFWFTFFHEAAHILLHGKRDIFMEGGEDDSQNDKEEEANRWAADFLVPRNRYDRFVKAGSFTRETVVALADELGIAPGILVGRLQLDGHLPYNRMNQLKKRFTWVAMDSA